MLGELRAGNRCGWVPISTLSLVGARGRPPPHVPPRKKRGFHAVQVVSPGEKGQSAKTLSSSPPPPPHSGKKLSPH